MHRDICFRSAGQKHPRVFGLAIYRNRLVMFRRSRYAAAFRLVFHAAMLTALSVLLVVLGVCLNRMANRYFRQHALPAQPDQPRESHTLKQRWRRWPRQLLALFSYLLGFVLIVYGASHLIG